MKYTFRNDFDSISHKINLENLRSAKTRCCQFYRDYPSSTIIYVYNGPKLICSKKMGDRFWSDGLRNAGKYNTHKHTPGSPLLMRLENLQSKQLEYKSQLLKIKEEIKNTKAVLKEIQKNKQNFLKVQKSIPRKKSNFP